MGGHICYLCIWVFLASELSIWHFRKQVSLAKLVHIIVVASDQENRRVHAELVYDTGDEGSELGIAAVEYALQFVGNPYVWGGTSLTKGADCSGFVLSVFKEYGYTLKSNKSKEGDLISLFLFL